MKFLFRSGWGESLAIARRVRSEGNEVLFSICEEAKAAKKVGDGLIDKTNDFPAATKWADVIVYDGNSFDLPKEAELLSKTKPVVGSSAFGDELEHDRRGAIQIVKQAGLTAPKFYSFKGKGAFDRGRRFLEKKDGGWVFKPNGDAQDIRTFVTRDVEEMSRMLEYAERRFEKAKVPPDFILEERHKGVEVSTEAWFTGKDWCVPNGTLEKNRLMDHDIGEMTGCAGNLVWLYNSLDAPLVKKLLIPLTPFLLGRYRGPVDVNSIIDDKTGEPIFLEFTTRFGIDAIFSLAELVGKMSELLASVANGEVYKGPLKYNVFDLGVRASIPPYPTVAEDIAMDFPIFGFKPSENQEGINPCEVRLDENEEVETSGPDGIVFVFTATGKTIREARAKLYERVDQIYIPNLRYRTDIGIDAERDYEKLKALGFIEEGGKENAFGIKKIAGGGRKSFLFG